MCLKCSHNQPIGGLRPCGSYVVALLNLTPLFEWYMVGFVVKNKHQKAMYYDEIGICTQNISTILGSIFDTIGRAYMIVLKERGYATLPTQFIPPLMLNVNTFIMSHPPRLCSLYETLHVLKRSHCHKINHDLHVGENF